MNKILWNFEIQTEHLMQSRRRELNESSVSADYSMKNRRKGKTEQKHSDFQRAEEIVNYWQW